MANKDLPRGLEPYGKIKDANEYEAGSAIAVGDAVVMASDGQVDPVATGGSVYSSEVLGVAISSASAAAEKVLIIDDPDQQYRIQADDASITAQTAIGLNYALIGTSPSGINSRMELDGSSGATDSTLPLRLLRLDKRPDNSFGSQADLIVKINNNQLAGNHDGEGL